MQTLPALAILRRRRPDARITLLVEDRCLPFVEGRPEPDEIRAWPRGRWRPWWASRLAPRALAQAVRFFAELSRPGFDVALDFQGNLKSGLHTWFSRAPVRVGFAPGGSREANILFTNRRVPSPAERRSRIEKYVSLLAGLGITGERPRPVKAPAGAQAAFEAMARASGLPPGPFFAVHPGTSLFGAYKRWPLARWRSLLPALARKAPVLLSYGPGEGEDASAFASLSGVFVPPEPPAIPAMAGAFAHAIAFAGPDSALLHLAHVHGTPAVGIFGPTDPALYAPWMTGEAVSAGLDCSPCNGRGCPGSPCMDAVEATTVLAAIERVSARETGA